MATCVERQTLKSRQLLKMLARHDFGTVSETHGTRGKQLTYRLPKEYEVHWSHRTAQAAGAAIILKKSFRAKFASFQEGDFVKLIQGRVARLRLHGPQGSLDIYAVYMHTGLTPKDDTILRGNAVEVIRFNVDDARNRLSILAGDWNYVPYRKDRWCCTGKTWTGDSDKQEARRYDESIWGPKQLYELIQEDHTYFSTTATSRLDRFYINNHVSEQLDHNFSCSCPDR